MEGLQIDGKPLEALRVVDLRKELEKRSLTKSGTKKDLIQRLATFMSQYEMTQGGDGQRQEVAPIVTEPPLAQAPEPESAMITETSQDTRSEEPPSGSSPTAPVAETVETPIDRPEGSAEMFGKSRDNLEDATNQREATRNEGEAEGETEDDTVELEVQNASDMLLDESGPVDNKQRDVEMSEEGQEQPANERTERDGDRTDKAEQAGEGDNQEDYEEHLVQIRRIGGNKGKDQENQGRTKRSWRSNSRREDETVKSISSETLKDIIPDIAPLLDDGQAEDETTEARSKADEEEKEEEKVTNDVLSDDVELHTDERFPMETDDNQKVEPPMPPVVEEEEDDQDMDGPNIISVSNLVRPFTINQLKELLSRTGEITEGGFVINRIKSDCVVKFRSARQARNTKAALDGVRWPSSNPKTLLVSFADESEFERLLREGDSMTANVTPANAHKAKSSEPKRARLEEPATGGMRLEEPKPMEALFNRTKAVPNIFWKMVEARGSH